MLGLGRGRRAAVTLAVAGALAAGGGSAIGWAATHQQQPPQPSSSAAGTPDIGASFPASAAATGTSDPASARGPVLGRSVPVAISVRDLKIRSAVRPIGQNPDGTIAVPQPGPHYDEAAWYTGSPTPGQVGPAVIEGHVDSAAQGPSIFYRLGALTPGKRIEVTRADRSVATFVVDGVRRYPKDRFPTIAVYGNTDRAALRLITCGGSFDRARGHYRDNIVVFAHLIGSRPPR